MSTKLSSWKHYVKIDHWEKDEWGDTFMVDMNGKRWLYCSWIGRKGYSYDPSRQIPIRPIIRTMKQNRKVIFYRTFNQEEVNPGWATNGVTLPFEKALYDFLYIKDGNISSDSCDTLVELLLE